MPAHQGVRDFTAFILAYKCPESGYICPFLYLLGLVKSSQLYLFYCMCINLAELLHVSEDGDFLFVIATPSCECVSYFHSIKMRDCDV